MKSTVKLFYGPTVFLGFVAVIYVFDTQYPQDTGNIIDENQGRLEWAGATSLILAALMTLMFGGYSHFTERRSNITPSDFEEVEIADNAGTLGFFSTSSIWPPIMTMGILLMDYGVAFMAYWLIVLGAVILIIAGAKLNAQYITPPEKHQSKCNWTEPQSQITEKSLPPTGLLVGGTLD